MLTTRTLQILFWGITLEFEVSICNFVLITFFSNIQKKNLIDNILIKISFPTKMRAQICTNIHINKIKVNKEFRFSLKKGLLKFLLNIDAKIYKESKFSFQNLRMKNTLQS